MDKCTFWAWCECSTSVSTVASGWADDEIADVGALIAIVTSVTWPSWVSQVVLPTVITCNVQHDMQMCRYMYTCTYRYVQVHTHIICMYIAYS